MTGNNLENKIVLVTGAARRIGAAIVTRLHDDGARIAIHYRGSAADAEELARRLNEKRDDSARTFQADLLMIDKLPELVDDVLDWGGALDALVNNASTFYPTPVGDITEEQWEDLVGSNFKAPLFMAQAAAPFLRESRGCIINMVDIHARKPLRDHPVYGPAKAALAMLTLSLAKDLAPDRVNIYEIRLEAGAAHLVYSTALISLGRLLGPLLLDDANPLTVQEEDYLDQRNNRNGRYDVGDLRAYLLESAGASQ